MPEERTGVRLILADGTEIEGGRAGYAGGFLWCRWNGTMQEAAALFFDPEKTAVIRFQYGGMEDSWEGFTECTNIHMEDGQVYVCMTRGNG